MKTSELTGAALDWAVAKAKGYAKFVLDPKRFMEMHETGHYNYSTDWSQGGPIIEREKITTYAHFEDVHTESGAETTIDQGWAAHITPRHYWQTPRGKGFGPTPLIASMRCYVASELGDTVDVPEDLTR